MAVVDAPALSLRASGNLGAICYSRWRGLKIARGVWTGTYPGYEKQLAINANMTAVSQAWGQTLTPEQREAWNEAACEQTWKNRMGGDYVPIGYQYYLKLNLVRKFLGLGISVFPPTRHYPILALEFVPYWYAGTMSIKGRLTGYVAGQPPDGVLYDRAGPFDSGGRRALAGEYRFTFKKSHAATFTDYDLVSWKWYWYRAKWYLDSGVVGNWFYAQIQAQEVV